MTIPFPSRGRGDSTAARERTPEAVAAFEAMFRAHYEDLCDQVRRIVKSSAVAEELVQDVFAQIWERLDVLDETRNPAAYLRTAAKRHALNYLTREGLAARYLARQDRAEPEVEGSVIQDIEDRELEARVREATDKLPRQMRMAWRLRRERGMTHEEISRAMGISIKTVERHLGKAFKRLRVSLAGYLALVVATMLSA
jgi:RNA polymerase sigma-70 factor (ECF subfamily)